MDIELIGKISDKCNRSPPAAGRRAFETGKNPERVLPDPFESGIQFLRCHPDRLDHHVLGVVVFPLFVKKASLFLEPVKGGRFRIRRK